jgi:hypothetical protein
MMGHGPMRPVQEARLLPAVGVLLGLLVYLLPLYATAPRSGPGGAGDRAHGVVVWRHRQPQLDVLADDRPLPRPTLSALPPACVPGVLAPLVGGCPVVSNAVTDLASRPASPGRPRSPPAS